LGRQTADGRQGGFAPSAIRRLPSAVRRLLSDQFDLIIVPPMKLREAQEGTPVAECRPRARAVGVGGAPMRSPKGSSISRY